MNFLKNFKLMSLFLILSSATCVLAEVAIQLDLPQQKELKFEGFDRTLLTMLESTLAKDPADIQEIVRYYKSLHRLSEEIKEIRASRSMPLDGEAALEDVTTLEEEEEARQAQLLIEKMKREMKPGMLKDLHRMILQKVPAPLLPKVKAIVTKILEYEVAEVRAGKSLFKEFIHLSSDKIDDWLAGFRKLDAVDLLSRELRVLFMGLKTHLKKGKELFMEMQIPDPVEQVNQPEEQQ